MSKLGAAGPTAAVPGAATSRWQPSSRTTGRAAETGTARVATRAKSDSAFIQLTQHSVVKETKPVKGVNTIVPWIWSSIPFHSDRTNGAWRAWLERDYLAGARRLSPPSPLVDPFLPPLPLPLA